MSDENKEKRRSKTFQKKRETKQKEKKKNAGKAVFYIVPGLSTLEKTYFNHRFIFVHVL
jgi:hypothetical protein